MQAADLNLTTTITGYQRFLFLKLPTDGADGLAQAIDKLGEGMENMHYVDGSASAEVFAKGRFQILRAERGMSQERDLPHPGISEADGLVRLEAETEAPLLKYEGGLRVFAGTHRRQRRDAVRRPETSQLHQPRHDPIRLCPRTAARPRKRSSHWV